ncbi:MAG: lysylphosphatidylglycerol synthase transmembrane domain-containing protein [Actinomycetota bacterium]
MLLSRLATPLRRGAAAVTVALVVEYLVLPQFVGARKSLSTLSSVNLAYLGIAVGLEIAALVAYALLTRSVLPRTSTTPGLWTLFRIDMSTLSLSHVLPGGGAAGASLGFRLMTDNGIRGTDAAFTMATQGIGSAVVLNALLWLGLIATIPARGFSAMTAYAAVTGILLITILAVLVVGLTQGEARAIRVVRWVSRRAPFLDELKTGRIVERLALRLRELGGDRSLLVRASGWAAANWLLDAASLWVFIRAFGHTMDIAGLLVAFGLANVLAVLPITPGGLGIVEGVLTPTLVGFGAPGAVALLGVISWRLINFWLPIPAGGAAYLSLKLSGNGQSHIPMEEAAEQPAPGIDSH